MSEEIKNTNTETVSKNFIEIEIDKDLESGRFDHVQTMISAGAERLPAYRSCKINYFK